MKKLFCVIALMCAFASISFSTPPPCRAGEIPMWKNGEWSCEPTGFAATTVEEPNNEDVLDFGDGIKVFLSWLIF